MAKLIQVIETEAIRGKGIESDPIRRVKQYFSVDGELLAERDLFLEVGHVASLNSVGIAGPMSPAQKSTSSIRSLTSEGKDDQDHDPARSGQG